MYIYIALERNKPIRNSKMLRVPQVFHHEKKNAPCSFPHGAQPGDGRQMMFAWTDVQKNGGHSNKRQQKKT